MIFDDSLLPERATEIITKTRPIPRPVEEEETEGEGEESSIGETDAENPEATAPDDEPVLPPDEQPGEAGNMTDPPAEEWPEPGLEPGAPDPSGDSDNTPPPDVWTEPPVEEWPEPGLDEGEETEAG